MRKEPLAVVPGELSGDSEGKDTRDLAELGVTRDCFLDLERPLPGLCSFADICEDLRSRRPSPLVSMADCGSYEVSCKKMIEQVEVLFHRSDVAPQDRCCGQSGLKAFVMI